MNAPCPYCGSPEPHGHPWAVRASDDGPLFYVLLVDSRAHQILVIGIADLRMLVDRGIRYRFIGPSGVRVERSEP